MTQSPGNYRLNGLNPLAYMGVNPPSPANLVIRSFPPTTTDSQNFQLGSTWLVPTTTPEQYWLLVNLEQGVATWIQLYPATSAGDVFPTDSGTATPAGGILNIFGGTNINTAAPGPANTVQVNLNNSITLSGTLTLSSYGPGVLQVPVIAGPVFSSSGTDGQVLIAASVGNAEWENITPGTGITIANAANSITVNLSTPVSIAHGGTNATSMANTDGVVYYDGTRLVTTAVGTATQVLTSNGAGMAPTFQAAGGGTNPAASCTFFYYQATDAVGVIGGSPSMIYPLGSAVALTMLYDNTSGSVNPGNGSGIPASFTAPADGVYWLQCTYVEQGASGSPTLAHAPQVYIQVTGSLANVYNIGAAPSFSDGAFIKTQGSASAIIPMDIGDIAEWNLVAFPDPSGPNSDVLGNGSIQSAAPSGFQTWIAGYRIL